jgi:hypothetical protein
MSLPGFSRIEGPRHHAWLRIRRRLESLRSQCRQFNDDLASAKDNDPGCNYLPVKPIDLLVLPEVPPEPAFEE